jgi:glycine/sarcosine N-methyltransferase
MYDALSSDYDRFVSWPGRLAFELPFLEKQLQRTRQSASVLDAACGTGMHAIALARLGFQASGADLSAGMVQKAQANAAAAGVRVNFTAAGFSSLAGAFGSRSPFPYDNLICLGNSLPHLLTHEDLHAALLDFAACLKPGGTLVIQNRNFDAVMANRQRWMEPQSQREGGAEWLFLRFYDFEPSGLIGFNIVTLHRKESEPWQQQVSTSKIYPLCQQELSAALKKSGFGQVNLYGGMGGDPFDPESSPNLVVTAVNSG